MSLIEFTDKGLYCRQANVYIDPWKPVPKAIITHGHSDHAYVGHQHYLCHHYTKPILQTRLGDQYYQSIDWKETISINSVKFSLYPSGHIIGASQVRVEFENEVWVVSGDYKTENDGISGSFEPVKCNTFITESTFGLPIYNWMPQEILYERMRQWVLEMRTLNKTPVFIAYSLGKAQRVLNALEPLGETLYAHGATYNLHMALVASGFDLPKLERITPDTPKNVLHNSIIIAPPGADGSTWMNKFQPYATGICSGWMQVRGNVRRRNADEGFILSDHADWNGLLKAIEATEAEKVYVTHGFQSAFSRYLNEKGIWSAEVKTEYGKEDEEEENPQEKV